MNKHLFIGTSGWSYKDWSGIFYPEGVKASGYLSAYAGHFKSIEIDSTFYGAPRPESVERWFLQVPDEFVFCPKTPQIITHEKRLVNCEPEWQLFLQTMSILKHKLGPIVLQFDYDFSFKKYFTTLQTFLQKNQGYKIGVEIRYKDWFKPEFYHMLRESNTALVLNDIYYLPRQTEVTADFTYIRLLGDRRQIPDDFSRVRVDRTEGLDYWATWITAQLEKELDVYVYSNNRYQGHAPATIHTLQEKLDNAC
jgi:uncharacterized protein YecE (DUF72 family)